MIALPWQCCCAWLLLKPPSTHVEYKPSEVLHGIAQLVCPAKDVFNLYQSSGKLLLGPPCIGKEQESPGALQSEFCYWLQVVVALCPFDQPVPVAERCAVRVSCLRETWCAEKQRVASKILRRETCWSASAWRSLHPTKQDLEVPEQRSRAWKVFDACGKPETEASYKQKATKDLSWSKFVTLLTCLLCCIGMRDQNAVD